MYVESGKGLTGVAPGHLMKDDLVLAPDKPPVGGMEEARPTWQAEAGETDGQMNAWSTHICPRAPPWCPAPGSARNVAAV